MNSVQLYKKKLTILVVDDTPDNLILVSSILKNDFNVKVANQGEKALRIAKSVNPPDLILLDIVLPEMDGYEICIILKSDPKTMDIPIIFLTSKTDIDDEKLGFELGAVDYIFKPFSPSIVLARVKTHLKLKLAADFLKDQNQYLEFEVNRRTTEVRAIQEVTILALASLAETRDNDTGFHLHRTQLYVKILSEKLQTHPNFLHYLTENNMRLLYKLAPLHDIGKVGIPDRILLKPGKLTPEEFEIMKTHTILGKEAIERAENQLGVQVDFLKIAKEIVHYHHEKWNGTGYPNGLYKNQIPISARLMALADVYDALISSRVYKDKMSNEDASQIILDGRGTHFDPDIVDAFWEIKDEFSQISKKYKD